ncbi:MAG: hypothetical protein J7L63_03155 [Thermoplasmata archaeon]|nr:hypothetical protein [Thermoplasmata archaeon]
MQLLLILLLIMLLGSARGRVTLYFVLLFLQILGAIYIFAVGTFALSLLVAMLFRKVAYSIIIGVVYGLLVIMGFFILSSDYSPGITYLMVDYSYAWSPLHYIPYVIFGIMEWGIIPVLLIFPLVWIISVMFVDEAYFRGV